MEGVRRGNGEDDADQTIDVIDDAGRDSFPASDPPPWTLGVRPDDDDADDGQTVESS